MAYTFLIVDDERISRNYIRDLINEFAPGNNIAEAASARSAIEQVQAEHPDVLFLDIKMPGMDGFDFLKLTPDRNFELVFITAYSQYAIKAIKEGVTDYLLKPIRKTDFKETLEKVIRKCERKQEKKGASTAQGNEPYMEQKLIVNHQQGMKMILLRDIIYLKADNTYTTLFLTNKEKITTTKPIHRFEELLDNNWFFRIHKSYIINLHHFKEYSSREGNTAVMDTGERLTISRYRNSDFLEKIKNFTGKMKI